MQVIDGGSATKFELGIKTNGKIQAVFLLARQVDHKNFIGMGNKIFALNFIAIDFMIDRSDG